MKSSGSSAILRSDHCPPPYPLSFSATIHLTFFLQNLIADDRRAVPDAGLDFTAEIAIVMLPIFTDRHMDMSTFTDQLMDVDICPYMSILNCASSGHSVGRSIVVFQLASLEGLQAFD